MTSSEIRDKLLEQRALYKQSLERSKTAKENINDILAQISDENVTLLLEQGIDVRNIVNIDLDRLQKDSVYVAECEKLLEDVITKLHKYLEDAVNV